MLQLSYVFIALVAVNVTNTIVHYNIIPLLPHIAMRSLTNMAKYLNNAIHT